MTLWDSEVVAVVLGLVVRVHRFSGPLRFQRAAYEWLKEHAWKAIRAKRIEYHRSTRMHNRFDDFPLQNAR